MRRRETPKVVGLLAIIVVVNWGLSTWYRDVVMAESVATRTEAGFAEVAPEVDVLIVGDSHSKWGVHPSALPRAYNLALPGQPYAETYYTLRRVLDEHEADPSTVVLQVGFHSFSERRVQWGQAYHYAPFVSYWAIGLRHGDLLEHVVRQFLGRHAPYVAQRFYILQYLQYREPVAARWWYGVEMDRGAMLAETSLADESTEKRSRDAGIAALRHFQGERLFDPATVEDFRDILELTKSRGVALVLVRFPMSREFLEATAARIDVDDFDRHFEALVAPYDHVTIIDERSRFVDAPELFLNHTHLNTRGGVEMTKLLERRIRASSDERV